MSRKRRRIFSREFKLSAIERILAGASTKALSQELGVDPDHLLQWCHRFRIGGAEAVRQGSFRVAPHLGFDWTIPGSEGQFAVAPLARYIRSIGYAPPHFTDINQVQFHPVIRAKMGEKWLFSMFEEKEIIYDMLTQGWFVPLDFMVHWQALPYLSIALGGARSLYASYPQYENTVYGRLSFTF